MNSDPELHGFYGLSKYDKEGLLLRSVVNFINSAAGKMSKFIKLQLHKTGIN